MARLTTTDKQSGLVRRITRSHGYLADLTQHIAAWLMGESGQPQARARVEMDAEADAFRHITFVFAMIALAAKLTRCDGTISREEFLTFREVFPLQDAESAKIRRLFRLAWEDTASAEYYARQVVYLYPDNPDVRRELMFRLCAIALSDGPLTSGELKLLREIGSVFGYTRLQLGRLLAEANPEMEADPFRVLGLKRGARHEQIRRQYHALMRLYHPDHVFADVHYPEARAVAERKSAAINAAYKSLTAA
jgi:DnaJ like chaperone protein